MQTHSRETTLPLPPVDDDRARREEIEAALSHAFCVALPRANACVSSRLGFSTPSYARGFSHGYETLLDVARDCVPDDDPQRLLRMFEGMIDDRTGAAGSWSRVAAEMREERALELIEHVLRLPQPQREVVTLRSVGVEWRRIVKMLPGRAYFSVVEDYVAALRALWSVADDLVQCAAAR